MWWFQQLSWILVAEIIVHLVAKYIFKAAHTLLASKVGTKQNRVLRLYRSGPVCSVGSSASMYIRRRLRESKIVWA